MRFPMFVSAAFCAAALLLGGCSTAPETGPDRTQLHNDAQASLNDFKTQDPSLDNVLHNAYGFAIFPSIGKGASALVAPMAKARCISRVIASATPT